MNLYHIIFIKTVKTGPTLGVTSWNNRNKEGIINFVGKMTQMSDPGPSWPSCFITVTVSLVAVYRYLVIYREANRHVVQ